MAIVDVLNQIKIETLFIDQIQDAEDPSIRIIGCNKDYLVLVDRKESWLNTYKIEKNQVGLNLNRFSFILNDRIIFSYLFRVHLSFIILMTIQFTKESQMNGGNMKL